MCGEQLQKVLTLSIDSNAIGVKRERRFSLFLFWRFYVVK